jgi:hypothetical protein
MGHDKKKRQLIERSGRWKSARLVKRVADDRTERKVTDRVGLKGEGVGPERDRKEKELTERSTRKEQKERSRN